MILSQGQRDEIRNGYVIAFVFNRLEAGYIWVTFPRGGSLTDKDEPYTATALKGVMKNVENATYPDGDG